MLHTMRAAGRTKVLKGAVVLPAPLTQPPLDPAAADFRTGFIGRLQSGIEPPDPIWRDCAGRRRPAGADLGRCARGRYSSIAAYTSCCSWGRMG